MAVLPVGSPAPMLAPVVVGERRRARQQERGAERQDDLVGHFFSDLSKAASGPGVIGATAGTPRPSPAPPKCLRRQVFPLGGLTAHGPRRRPGHRKRRRPGPRPRLRTSRTPPTLPTCSTATVSYPTQPPPAF